MRGVFVELPAVTRAMEALRLPDAPLSGVREEILLGGGLRVYFITFDHLAPVVLALISSKDVEANISLKDQKALSRLASELRKELTREQE